MALAHQGDAIGTLRAHQSPLQLTYVVPLPLQLTSSRSGPRHGRHGGHGRHGRHGRHGGHGKHGKHGTARHGTARHGAAQRAQ